jgi:hypothetical protein
MTTFTKWLTGGLAAVLATAGGAVAAEQTVLGTAFTVKNPTGANDKRGVIGVAKEKGSSNTLVGDPTLNGIAGGAVLDVSADGGTSTQQTFVLPQGLDLSGKPFWKTLGTTGYIYKDSKGANGPVKMAQLKATTSGVFQLKIVIGGKYGPVDVVPPDPGTTGCFAIQLSQDGSGDRYSAEFGPTSIVKNSGPKLFKATKPTAEGVCPLPAPTTTSTSTSTTAPAPTSTSTSTSSTTTDTIPVTTSSTSTSTSTVTTTSTTTSTVGGPAPDPSSPVASTSACLTNDTGAQAAIQVTLFDTMAAPLPGATVVMNTTAGTLSAVQSSGNLYWATLTAPASGVSATVSVTANGTPLTTTPTITLASPLTDTTGGAGGCAQDGNLRVRVVNDLGLPIMGASVLVGDSELLNQYVTTFNSSADGATSATTDVSGYATFRDFGATLSGPVTVTAGAASRQYVTIASANASDVVLPLKPIVPSVSTGTLTGNVSGISSSSNVEVGVVLGDVTLDTLASFNLTALLADNACYMSPVGNFNVPNNVYIPAQTVIIIGIPQKSYVSAALPFGQRRIITLGGNVPVGALTGGGGIAAALTQLTFTNITANTQTISTPGPTALNPTVSSYGSTTACTATGAPGTDAFCIAAMDWDGNTTPTHTVGEGPLGVFSFKAGAATGGNVNLTAVNYKSKTAGAPNPFTAVGHMGATVSLFLDQTTAPPATGRGVSVILKRDFPSDTLPSTFAYGAMYPIRAHSQTGRTLTLDVPAGLGTAQYVKHSLSQVISVVYSGCAANDSTRTTSNPLWDVYTPVGSASVTLPTLPASFPRATLSGNLPGLIDPTATAEDDEISWTATTIREGLNGSFSYDQLRMTGFRKYGTNFTTNSADFVP